MTQIELDIIELEGAKDKVTSKIVNLSKRIDSNLNTTVHSLCTLGGLDIIEECTQDLLQLKERYCKINKQLDELESKIKEENT